MKFLIRGGHVVDGRGGEPYLASVLIDGDRIVCVSSEIETTSDMYVLEAAGNVVTPGFIDIHSHSDYTLVIDPRASSALHQGVTLEVIGNCGHGCFPVRDATVARRAVYGYSDTHDAFTSTGSGFFDLLQSRQPAVNVLSLVPHGQLRLSSMGHSEGQSTKSEQTEMLRLLDAELAAGAWGLSTGLEYAAEREASEHEIQELCSLVADADGIYASHTRFRNEGPERGVKEALDVARSTGVRLQVSHLLPRGGYEDSRKCIRLIEDALSEGLDVAFDMHTRLHGFTYLSVGLPQTAFSGSRDEISARLESRAFRDEVKSYRGMFNFERDADRLVLTTGNSKYIGQSLAEIAAERSQTPNDAAHDLLLASVDELNALTVSIPTYTREEQLLAFGHPHCMPASDATSLSPDGVLGDRYFPGAYSWAAWFVRFFSQDNAILPLEEAIRKLTALPAERLGLTDRGVIQEGNFADVVVFAAADFSENTSQGSESLASGMRHVLVNGSLALVDGSLTECRAGRVLRR